MSHASTPSAPKSEAGTAAEPRNVVILGSGCAGLTAAVYAARGNLRPLLIDGHESGGQLSLTTDVENFPGFPKGILGPELIENMRQQAARFGTDYLSGSATAADLSRRPFRITIDGEREIYARALIIASGASARLLGLPSERRLIGHGVSTCATCDGFFFKDREIMVVGGGDSALEEANFLTKFARKVTVVHRRDTLRASKIMQDRATKNPKIHWVWDSEVAEIHGADKVTSVKLRNLKTNALTDMKIDGLFVAIGHVPNTRIFEGQIDMDKAGYITTRDGSRTNVAGVFAAGDCMDFVYRQAITAAGSGCKAAIDAERWLEAEGH
ncbi:MAG TPA: thioredoxin-disulfide reductase [Candidatus Polarisedimenticolia bacterium]|nr:thioredoxin-disulfide reductase [Candidatus Polarisedimenticolia bacterium]